MTGAIFLGLGVAGQAWGATIKCVGATEKVTKLATTVSTTAKVSGKIAIGMDVFDLGAMGWGHFDPDNPPTALNQYLHGNKYYNYFQLGTNMLAVFSGGANSTKVCFVAGTLIMIPDGMVAIEDICVGDEVVSTCIDTFEVAEKTVVQTFIRESKELVHLTINGEVIKTTPEHPFYVKQDGFVNACELKIGDELLNAEQDVLIVQDTYFEICDEPVVVYNFEVDDFHTYHVGNVFVLVHNANRVDYGNHIQKEGNKNVLAPDVEYIDPNGYKYVTDVDRRIISAEGTLVLETGNRNAYAQRIVGGTDRLALDDGGHLFGTQFKGSGGIDNLVPQSRAINRARGEWYVMEIKWRNAINAGKKVNVKIKNNYLPNNARPISFDVEYWINKEYFKVKIKN